MTWSCPCNVCKKAQKIIIDQIIEEYKSCPNIVEVDERLYCSTWYRHDDCVRLMELLNKITNKDLYSLPKIREEVKEAMDKEKEKDRIQKETDKNSIEEIEKFVSGQE